MKKKLNFILSLLLVLIVGVSAFCVPASSFANDVETTSTAIMLLNTDTDTIVYSQKIDNLWYAGELAELMTFIVASQSIISPEDTKIKVERSFIDALPYSDGCLDQFVGQTLTAKDLMAIMLITSGSDAAYLLADTVTGGDIDRFVSMMSKKATELGCKSTTYVTPGHCDDAAQHTTCRDISKIYSAVAGIPLYTELISQTSYTPEGMDEKKFTVTTNNSILNESSPYYFRYATGGKYATTPRSRANIVVTTTYRNKSYLFVALCGRVESERNAFYDARRLTTWAYLNLVDRKIVDADNVITTTTAYDAWGEYEVDLFAGRTAYKTLPIDYDESKLTYEFNLPERIALPIFEGQSLGTATLQYDGETIDQANIVAPDSEGVSMLHDIARFGKYGFLQLLPNEPVDDGTAEATEPATQAATVAPSAEATQATEPATEG